jgi:DNA-nicking Smr family endonuclease
MRKGRGLSKEERTLWDGVTRSVAPLRRRNIKSSDESHGAPEPVPALPASPKRPAIEAQSSRKSRQPSLAPLDRKLKQRLRRGNKNIDARIDLHGDTQAEAHAKLQRFLRGAQDKGAATVLVITGKGGRPGREGVLKRQVPLWLGLPEFREYVLGFDTASPAHGGEGALYVRIRKRRRSD